MSAWYIFTALGFYPLNPASGDYMIGSPLFRKVTVELPNFIELQIVGGNQDILMAQDATTPTTMAIPPPKW